MSNALYAMLASLGATKTMAETLMRDFPPHRGRMPGDRRLRDRP
jgi:hypothetical protein